VTWTIPWVATMSYGFRIAPPDYVGTMSAMIGTVEFTICKLNNIPPPRHRNYDKTLILAKGFANFVGGQILAHTSWNIPDLFICTGKLLCSRNNAFQSYILQPAGSVCTGLSLILLTIYHCHIKNGNEKKLLEKKEAMMEKLTQKEGATEKETLPALQERRFSILPANMTLDAFVSTKL
jgi:hypothetical protein